MPDYLKTGIAMGAFMFCILSAVIGAATLIANGYVISGILLASALVGTAGGIAHKCA